MRRDCFNCKYDDCICEEFIYDDFKELRKAEMAAGVIKKQSRLPKNKGKHTTQNRGHIIQRIRRNIDNTGKNIIKKRRNAESISERISPEVEGRYTGISPLYNKPVAKNKPHNNSKPIP